MDFTEFVTFLIHKNVLTPSITSLFTAAQTHVCAC